MLIEGEEEVKTHLRQMIQTVEKELFESIKTREREFSTRILSEIFDIIPRRVRQSRNEVEKQRRLRDLHDTVMVLDTLIENNKLNPYLPRRTGSKEITHLSKGSFSENFANFAFHTYRLQISEPRTVLLQCESSKTYRIRIDKHGTPHFGTDANDKARDEWMAHRTANEEWMRYFFERYQMVDFSDEQNEIFFGKYGFEPKYIAMLEDHLDDRAKKKQGVSYTCIREEDIIRKMIGSLRRDQLHNFLDFLIYHPGRNFGICMYVPLSDRSEYDYVFGKSAVSLTMGSLMTYITRGGTMMTHYGETFNEYVANQLQTKSSLHVVRSEVVFWKDGKKASGTQKKKGDEIRVDILATLDDIIYVVSCKARGFLFEFERESNLMFVPFSQFYNRTKDNLKDIQEVLGWVEFIKESPDRLEELRVQGKQIKPLLITAECEPLQLERVKDWYQNEVEPVSECEQYAVADLEREFPITSRKKDVL